MAINEIHVGDIGTDFIATIKDDTDNALDISSATIKEFKFKRPTTGLLITNPSFVTDGTDGQLHYVSVSGDISEDGRWQLQAFVELSGISQFNSDIKRFVVYGNLCED